MRPMVKTSDCFPFVSNCYVSIQNGLLSITQSCLQHVKWQQSLVIIYNIYCSSFVFINWLEKITI